MYRLVSKRLTAALILALLLCLGVCARAASYENEYGVTLERIRVREKASLTSEIVDNIRPDSCVFLLEAKKSGGTTFVRLRYRTLEGRLETGWAALKSGSSVYIQALEESEAESRFSVRDGRLPTAPAGTMDSAERAARSGGAEKESADDEGGKKEPAKTGASVREAQEGLLALGLYYGEVTGHAGEKTVAAIRAFQASKGLKETGEADSATLKAIRAAVKKQEPAASGSEKKEQKTSASVKEAQEGLLALGLYNGEVTGHAGEKTVAAIRAFQASKGLKETGEADSATLKAIRTAVSSAKKADKAAKTPAPASGTQSSGTLRLDSSGSAVRTLQKNLTTLGYYYGDITGHYGEMTVTAVRKFQRDNGLDETGRADRSTQKKIASAAARAKKGGASKGASGRYYNLDWFKAKENGVFPKIGFGAGKTATLKDIETGKSLQVRIQSSGSHLDVEPVDEKDTKTLCSIYGVSEPRKIGAWRRAMVLTTAHGYRIVCSCYGTPHGNKMVYGNKYPGQLCLHFLNSKTSGSGVVDNGHQAAVRRAVASIGKSRMVRLDDPDDLN